MSLSRTASLALLLCVPAISRAQQVPAPQTPASPEASEALVAQAQETPAQALKPRPSLAPVPQGAEGRIHLDVVVTDASGKPVSGLDLNDFTLQDSGLPSRILSFHAHGGDVKEATPQVEIVLAIDTVNDNHQQVAFARQQIGGFLRQNGGHLAQPVSIDVVTDGGVQAQPQPSTDGNALAAMVDQLDNQLRTIGRAAGYWGANDRFQFSLKMLDIIIDSEAKKPGRKLLIWAGPGWPLFDNPKLQASYTSKAHQQDFNAIVQLSARLREARIGVYSISPGTPGFGTYLYRDFLKGVKTPDAADLSNLNLKVLAVESGGRVTGPDNDLTAQIDQCVQDAAAYYTISFDPPRADRANEYHDLKVLVGKPGLTARTSTGYYNQP